MALARDRLSGVDIPRSLRDVDAAWLTRTLSRSHPGVRVAGFEVIDRHSGTTARARLRLEYDEAAGAPPHLFLKLSPPGLVNRLFVAVAGLARNEVGFYRDVQAAVSVRTPRAHAVLCSPSAATFALLLEDLAAAGARFSRVGDHVELVEAFRVVEALAALHASFWQSDRFERDLAWVPSYEARSRRDMPWERFVTGQMVGIAARRFASELDDPALQRTAEFVTHRRDHLEALLARGDRTLVHGDCHVGNLFFMQDRIGFYDWQVCARAPGMRDVSYFLCNSFPSTLRAEHEHALIERYLESLAGQGVDPPSRDSAFEQHRLYALYTFIAAAFTAGAGDGLQPLEIGLAGLRRALTAVRELESVDCAEAHRT